MFGDQLQHMGETPTFNEAPVHEDSGAVMAGAAWFIGAAFCPQIRQVQAIKNLAEAKDDLNFSAHGELPLRARP